MLDHIKEFVGNLWGATTTQSLAFLVMIQPVLAQVDPALLENAPWLRWTIFGVTAGIAILRWKMPPPPAVAYKKADRVTVNHAAQTVTITKAEPIKDVVSKAAGEKV